MKLRACNNKPSGRIESACVFVSLAGVLALPIGMAQADSKDGTFPTAEQVGGQVYIEPIAVGKKLPLDFDAYDLNGKKADLGSVVRGKRSMVVFFISAVPVSVNELVKIENYAAKYGKGINLVFINADTVGVALMGGKDAVIPSSVKTMRELKKEQRLKTNAIYVAPNDALSADGVSTRLGIRGLPTSFVVDANGNVEKVFVGPQDWKKGAI